MKRICVAGILCMALLFNPSYIAESYVTHEDIVKGMASWYSETDPGILRTTANMEIFDDQGLSCAMWGVPFNTLVKITNVANGRSVIVRVNDRGPAMRLVKEGRVIDLTKKAFSSIADTGEGLIRVELNIMPRS